ncbi:MAG: DUF2267 domain-containing protein [Candidatus Krumholzibacteriales bacterium]
MSITGLRSLDRSVIETREWLKEVKEELLYDDEQDAYQVIRAVLHALRDRLSVQQAADLAAQMPMVLSGLYYEGWHPAGKPEKIRSAEEFRSRVAGGLPEDKKDKAGVAIKAVFKTMEGRISRGEMEDMKSILPDDFKEFFEV